MDFCVLISHVSHEPLILDTLSVRKIIEKKTKLNTGQMRAVENCCYTISSGTRGLLSYEKSNNPEKYSII